ncbi:MAG: hypothetical protein LBV04_02070, partial [Deferribacteraceae bacterium]|nr:hypothetical protein [Deferribacteraceae bacterium]
TDVVFLDAGSTTLELAKLIREGGKRELTVITNAFNIAGELLDEWDINIFFVGGMVRHNVLACVGKSAESYLREFYPNKAFIGTNGFSAEKGVTTHNPTEAQIKIEVLNAAEERILLCDSSKYGKYAMGRVAPLSKFTKIISDTNLSENDQREIEATGTNLIMAKY